MSHFEFVDDFHEFSSVFEFLGALFAFFIYLLSLFLTILQKLCKIVFFFQISIKIAECRNVDVFEF